MSRERLPCTTFCNQTMQSIYTPSHVISVDVMSMVCEVLVYINGNRRYYSKANELICSLVFHLNKQKHLHYFFCYMFITLSVKASICILIREYSIDI